MEKNNRGITIISLLITIIVLLILSGITIAVSNIIEKAEKQQITTDMLLIQTKVKILMEKVSFNGDTETYYIGNRHDSGDFAGLYEYDRATLDSIGLEGIKLRDNKYLVDYQTGDITYQKGETVLKLSELIGGNT